MIHELDVAKSQLFTESVLFCREVFHNILQFISLRLFYHMRHLFNPKIRALTSDQIRKS